MCLLSARSAATCKRTCLSLVWRQPPTPMPTPLLEGTDEQHERGPRFRLADAPARSGRARLGCRSADYRAGSKGGLGRQPRACPEIRHIRASCACRFPPNDRVGAVVIATSRGRGRDRSSSHGRRRQMSAPPLTEPPRETTALSLLADRSSSGRRAALERQRGGQFAARRHPRHEGAKPRRPAIRGTRTCIWRTDRFGPSPRGSSDTCSRRRPSRRSFWAGGLPRRLRRCVDPPAGRAGGRR